MSTGRRGVAQPGRALGLGPRCRVFESRRPDHYDKRSGFHTASFVLKHEMLDANMQNSVFDYKQKAEK